MTFSSAVDCRRSSGASFVTQQALQVDLEAQIVSAATHLCERLAQAISHRTGAAGVDAFHAGAQARFAGVEQGQAQRVAAARAAHWERQIITDANSYPKFHS
ncbi:MAG: hypothetical protein ACLFQI_07580 [Halochromatium sp.]|uniref:hypothetical protein n=1 Tax=Halochromatium sp. TaxID=2049430 RepID=UPI00397AAD94